MSCWTWARMLGFQFIPSNAIFSFALQQAAALFLPRQHTSGSATCPRNLMGGRLAGCREGQALDKRCTQKLCCNCTSCQSKVWGFGQPQAEAIREREVVTEVSLLMEGGLCFSVGFWKKLEAIWHPRSYRSATLTCLSAPQSCDTSKIG